MIDKIDFSEFLKVVNLHDIAPMKLTSERLADLNSSIPNVQILWNWIYADGDPIFPETQKLILRPKFNFEAKQEDAVYFKHESIFVIEFLIIDEKRFQEIWKDEEVKITFMKKQVFKTVWPICRQQVLDGMLRLGLKPVTLPWIV